LWGIFESLRSDDNVRKKVIASGDVNFGSLWEGVILGFFLGDAGTF
jgi:hypothetical protein